MLKIAHRGVSGLAPENTRAAFKKAIDCGMDMIELDLQMSKDGHFVICHDFNLERIAGVDALVSELKLSELKDLDIGSWYDETFFKERMMTLEEVIKLTKNKIKLNLEYKIPIPNYKETVARLIDLLVKFGVEEEVLISSFNHNVIKYLKKYKLNLETAILSYALAVNPVNLLVDAKADVFNAHYLLANQQLVNQIQTAGYKINIWTVNQPKLIEKFKSFGVDGIMTDYPDLLK